MGFNPQCTRTQNYKNKCVALAKRHSCVYSFNLINEMITIHFNHLVIPHNRLCTGLNELHLSINSASRPMVVGIYSIPPCVDSVNGWIVWQVFGLVIWQ